MKRSVFFLSKKLKNKIAPVIHKTNHKRDTGCIYLVIDAIYVKELKKQAKITSSTDTVV